MGGGILLIRYHSLFQLLSTIYSDFKWNKQLFSSAQQIEKDIWTDDHLANSFVQWLKRQPEKELTSASQIVKNQMEIVSSSLVGHLETTFPQYKWRYEEYKTGKKSQYELKECIEKLFIIGNKNKDIVLLEEYRHPDISNLELDYFLPQYNIAFEYQVNKILCNSLIN